MKTYLDLFQALRTVESALGAHGDVEISVSRAFGSNIAVRVTVRTNKEPYFCEVVAGDRNDHNETALASLGFEGALRALNDRLLEIK